jgi:ribosomal protein S18 acetylase RimI-like enzyme
VFPGEPRQLAELRRWIASLLPPRPPRDDVTVVADELASNAIQHTRSGQGGQFAVEITRHGPLVRVSVADHGAPDGPRLIDDPQSEHGRGLLVVQGLSVRTGAHGDQRGRLIWADIRWARAFFPKDVRCQANCMADEISLHIRAYHPADRSQVMALASRLTEWVAPWRDPATVLPAVQGWVQDSIEALSQPGHAVYIAAAGDRIVGFVTVSERTHFTGQVDAYVGELAVQAGMERRGAATQLMAAAEAWAADRGLLFVTLETGAANQPARSLYGALGYQEEDIRLTKAIRSRAG